MIGLCVGSGQKPYDRSQGWTNLDINPRWEPDVVGDWNDLSMFPENHFEVIVAEQTAEHAGCGESNPFFAAAHSRLKTGGSLIVTVPDLRALAQRWLTGQITDYIYSVNLYGAFMSHEADRHRWNTSYEGWVKFLMDSAPWKTVKRFNWRPIEGSRVSADWWILGIEAVK